MKGRSRRRYLIPAFASATLLHVSSVSLHAQIAAVGPTQGVFTYPVANQSAGTAQIAYDPHRDIYLVISGYEGLWGTFLDGAGNALGSPFAILNQNAWDNRFAEGPHVSYSPDVNGGTGGFLVTWGNRGRGGTGRYVKTRFVAYPAGLIGFEGTVARQTESFHDFTGAYAAYSRSSRQFLVAWSEAGPDDSTVYARRLGLDGLVGPVASIGAGDVTALVWNPVSNEFALGYRASSYKTAAGDFAARVVRLTPQGEVLREMTVSPDPLPANQGVGGPFIAVSEATGNYVVVWSLVDWSTGAYYRSFTALLDSRGDMIARGSEASARAANAIAFNPASRTFALIGGCEAAICARQLNEHGELIADWTPVTSRPGLGGIASGAGREWFVAFTNKEYTWDFVGVVRGQRIATSATDGGPRGPALGDLCVGADPFAFFGGGVCVNGGWVPRDHPAAERTPTPPAPPVPGGCVTPDPFTFFGGGVCVNGGWVPRDHPLAQGR